MKGKFHIRLILQFSDFSGLRDKRQERVALRTTTYRDRMILRRMLKEIEFDYVNCLRPIHERASGGQIGYKSAKSFSVEVVKFLEPIPTSQVGSNELV